MNDPAFVLWVFPVLVVLAVAAWAIRLKVRGRVKADHGPDDDTP